MNVREREKTRMRKDVILFYFILFFTRKDSVEIWISSMHKNSSQNKDVWRIKKNTFGLIHFRSVHQNYVNVFFCFVFILTICNRRRHNSTSINRIQKIRTPQMSNFDWSYRHRYKKYS